MSVTYLDRERLFPVAADKLIPVASVLDIGCGIRPQELIIPRIHICCEPFEQYLNVLQNKVSEETDREYLFINADWETAIGIFPDNSVDTVFLIDIIEHLPKEKSLKLLKDTERIARTQVAVFTTLGFIPQYHPDGKDAWGLDGGAWQEHKSGWEPDDFGDGWDILVSTDFHPADNLGNIYDTPHGAIWAIKTLSRADSRHLPIPYLNQSDCMTEPEDLYKQTVAMMQRLLHQDADKYYGLLAEIIADMAKTGNGTDDCLDHGCLPLPVHYYSPLPDIKDLQQRRFYDRSSALTGIDWDMDRQVELLQYFGRRFGNECRWPAERTGTSEEFFTENGSFSFGCAAALHCIIRFFQPHRIMEIGSGNSSKIISNAVQLNMNQFGGKVNYTIIDPYPDEARIGKLANVNTVLKQPVETLPISNFSSLREGDILFIDSSHVVKTGSDVNFLILDVLPTLAPGVLIHLHDIHLPHEYPEVYHTNPSFRVFWTESYLLQAFLAFNHEFEILFSMWSITKQRPDVFRQTFTHFQPALHQLSSGSIWLRRKKP